MNAQKGTIFRLGQHWGTVKAPRLWDNDQETVSSATTFSAVLAIWCDSKTLLIVNNTHNTTARWYGIGIYSSSKNNPHAWRCQVQFTQFSPVHVLHTCMLRKNFRQWFCTSLWKVSRFYPVQLNCCHLRCVLNLTNISIAWSEQS